MKKLLKEIIYRRWVVYYLLSFLALMLCLVFANGSSHQVDTEVVNVSNINGITTRSLNSSLYGVGVGGAATGLGIFAGFCLIAAEMARRNP